MTKLEALAKDCIENHTHKLVDKPTKQDIYLREESIFIQGYRQSEKRIVELEEKISILLSCKNCPENKGGYICQKEYEGKCLSQKIQYIKELKEEIAELEKELEQAKKVQVVEHFEAYGQCRDSRRIASLETENAELKDKLKNLESVAEVRLTNWQKYEKENAELKAKIEKLKCCENCRFSIFDTDDLCVVGCNAGKCFNHEKWELQEE